VAGGACGREGYRDGCEGHRDGCEGHRDGCVCVRVSVCVQLFGVGGFAGLRTCVRGPCFAPGAGAVYCMGYGYGAKCQTWDRLQLRGNVTAIQALSGIGVTKVVLVRAVCRRPARLCVWAVLVRALRPAACGWEVALLGSRSACGACGCGRTPAVRCEHGHHVRPLVRCWAQVP
jgi:hypothetical protein